VQGYCTARRRGGRRAMMRELASGGGTPVGAGGAAECSAEEGCPGQIRGGTAGSLGRLIWMRCCQAPCKYRRSREVIIPAPMCAQEIAGHWRKSSVSVGVCRGQSVTEIFERSYGAQRYRRCWKWWRGETSSRWSRQVCSSKAWAVMHAVAKPHSGTG